MKTGPRIVLLFLAFFFAVRTPAQQTTAPTPTRDPVAVALLTKSLAAMTGGLPVSDVTLQGTARRIAGSDDETGTAVLKALPTGEARIDLSFPSGSRSEVVANSLNGPVGAWSGPDGSSNTIAKHNLAIPSNWFFPAFTVTRLNASQTYLLSYVGSEIRDGRAVEHVTALKQAQDLPRELATIVQRLSQMEIYLDSSTLLPVALTFNTHPDRDAGTDIPVEVRFSDYRLVNAAQVPFHVQKFINNGLVLDLQFDSVTLNTGLTASAFTIP